MNIELIKISKWLKTNKLSINVRKTSLILFHPRKANESLPLKLPLLFLDAFQIKQVSSAKFLGVQIDDNITWEQQIKLMQNKIFKNLGVLIITKIILHFYS